MSPLGHRGLWRLSWWRRRWIGFTANGNELVVSTNPSDEAVRDDHSLCRIVRWVTILDHTLGIMGISVKSLAHDDWNTLQCLVTWMLHDRTKYNGNHTWKAISRLHFDFDGKGNEFTKLYVCHDCVQQSCFHVICSGWCTAKAGRRTREPDTEQ